MPRHLAWAAILLILLSVSPIARGQLVALDSSVQGKYLGEYLAVWVDPTGQANLEAVKLQQQWTTVNEPIPNYGNSPDTFWFRLEIQSAMEDDSWVLVLSNALLDYVDFYSVSSDGEMVDYYGGGAQRKLSEREILHRYLVIPVRTHGKGNLTFYFRVNSFHAVQFPLALWSLKDFIAFDERETILTGVLLGSLFIMLLYNFFLYTTIREPIYLAYVASVFCFMMLQVAVKGFGYRFLWPDQLLVSGVSVFVSAFATIFFATTFASWFMQLKERRFRFMPLVELARWGALGCALLVLYLPDLWRLYCMTGFGLLAITMGFIAIFTYYRTDDRPIQIFAAGWVVLLIGALLFLLNKLGLVSVNIWTEQTMSVGTVIEVILFSMALGDRINSEKLHALKAKETLLNSLKVEREEKQKILLSEETVSEAKELTLTIQQETNERLESEIEERTAELKQATHRLAELVRLDPLTGVFNRHYFNESIFQGFNQCCRNQLELSLMMIDIDHFKAINDQYGHLAGDRCLIKVAGIIRRLAESGAGKLFRFGGEEFAVILPNISRTKAAQLAETIRSTLEATAFAEADGPSHVTVSVGVASLWPRRGQRPETLVGLADQVLYEAKKGGRNQVVVQSECEDKGLA